jgi:hypothetical protein
MTSHTCYNEPETAADEFSKQLDRWRRMILDLPAVRAEKIAAARAAINRQAYDDDQVLSETVARLTEDLQTR